MAINRDYRLGICVDLRWHPKLISSAKSLNIPNAYLQGLLLNLWGGAMLYADDGDLWRGSDEMTLRFIEAISEIPFEPGMFVDVLRLDSWLDEWLIHDWLDYAGKLLYAKYKSHNKKRLIAIWAKHGRCYGGGRDDVGMQVGCSWDVDGLQAGYDPEALALNTPIINNNPITLTLNPYALSKKKRKSPKGVVGENAGDLPGASANQQPAESVVKDSTKETASSLISFSKGSRAKGAGALHANPSGNGEAKTDRQEIAGSSNSFSEGFRAQGYIATNRNEWVTPFNQGCFLGCRCTLGDLSF